MTKARGEQFSLDAALRDPGFTPRQRDVRDLITRVETGEEAERSAAEKALLRVQSSIDEEVAARIGEAASDGRVRLLRLASQLAARTEASRTLFDAMCLALDSTDARVRRAAATALGKIKRPETETVLLRALDRERPLAIGSSSRDPHVLETIIAAVGKVGTAKAALALGQHLEHSDAADKAKLMLDRTLLREAPSELLLDRTFGDPIEVTLRCREGLEELLVGELGRDLAPRIPRDQRGRVDITLLGAPRELFRARTFLCFGFSLEAPIRDGADVASVVAELVSTDHARRIFRTFTEGAIRFRVTWAGGGKRRKATWDLARAVRAKAPELVNDPTDSNWDVVVREPSERRVRIELVPRVADPRLEYREADVPAASHPTLARALVLRAGAREEDVVWDPFVGSGSELCERSIVGPYGMLIGSDIDDAALVAARKNLDRAGATSALLRRADARSFDPRAIGGRARSGMTLIITNPPMGRRVAHGEDLEGLLVLIVSRARETLTRDGRLVWLSPLPRATRAAADKQGFRVTSATMVDMGGFPAELQVLERR